MASSKLCTRKRGLVIAFTLFTFTCLFYHTAAQQIDFECTIIPQQEPLTYTTSTSSIYGRQLTPQGSQRVLLVFAGFKGFENGQVPIGQWSKPDSLDVGYYLPDYVVYSPTTGETTTTPLLFNKVSDFDGGGPIDDVNNRSVSNILNMMSKPNEDFKFIGEVFTNPQGEPVLVVIDFATDTENVTPLTFHTQNCSHPLCHFHNNSLYYNPSTNSIPHNISHSKLTLTLKTANPLCL